MAGGSNNISNNYASISNKSVFAEESRIRIKVESPTSEFYVEVSGKSRVRELMKIIIKVWGDEYMNLYHKSTEMKSDQFLFAYNIKDGSIVKVKVFAEPPNEELVKGIKLPKRDCTKLSRFSLASLCFLRGMPQCISSFV